MNKEKQRHIPHAMPLTLITFALFFVFLFFLHPPASSLQSPAGTAHGKIVTGPYLQNVTPQSITICWELAKPATGVVEYSTGGGAALKVTSSIKQTFHEVTLTGLAADTAYKYRVTSGDGKALSGAFRTAPAGAAPFTFAVYGDSRSGHTIHKQILARMIKRAPAFVLSTGDFVADGRKQSEWDTFWSIGSPLTRNTPFYPSMGNHEKNDPRYYKYFSLPESGEGERSYAFAYGGAFFIVIDGDAALSAFAGHKTWLIAQLKRGQPYDFIFVMFHYPVFSSSKREPMMNLRMAALPLFQKYGVSAVLNGHDHFYERSVDKGIAYIIAGGGGAPLYDHVRTLPESKVRVKAYNYVIVRVEGKYAKVSVYDINDSLIDSFALQSPR